MAWIIGIAAVLALGYFLLGRLANSKSPKIQEMLEAGRQIREGEREPGEAMEQARARKHFDASDKYYDRIMDLQNEGKYSAALKLIEKALAEAGFDPDDDVYADTVTECFNSLVEDKSPQAILNFYDKLQSEGKAIAYAERHGQLEWLARSLADNLDKYPEVKTKAALKKAVDFARQDHPLIKEVRYNFSSCLEGFLDTLAANFFADWVEGESEGVEAIARDIEAVLDGKKQSMHAPDPADLTCTCEDWIKNRSSLPEGTPQRLCRHLTRFFNQNPEQIPPAMGAFREFIRKRGEVLQGMPLPRSGYAMTYGVLGGQGHILEKALNDSPWVNIRLPGGDKYGYSVREKRWAKGQIPERADALAQAAAAFASQK